ncbi:MAG: BT_3928 family protein [Sphingobacteriaceae bacterium]
MRKFFESKLFRAIWSIGLAAFIYWICPPCFSKTTLMVLLGIQLVLINAAPIIANWTWVTHIARILVGGLFIFSGFIKANDTLGFSYKLEEYFEVFKTDTGLGFFEWFAHISLPLAIIICASEIVLGVFLLIGYRRNLTLGLLFAQIAFFTFLTFYSACYNKVTHCGCFGDFLPLKPWESFWKDIALMILITLLFAGKDNINEISSPMFMNTLAVVGFVASFWFPIYTYRNLPVFDFRPYAIGKNIKSSMVFPADYQPAKYETRFIYKNLKTGELKEFDMKNYPWQDTLTWAHDSTMNVLIQDAINPPKISDLNISSLEGNNVTDSILSIKNYNYWLVVYDLAKTEDDEELHAKINDFYKLASQEKVSFIALTASGPKEIDNFKHKHNALYDFVTVDATVLKTMIRSNPGLMLVKDATVIMNWHHHNFPTYSDAKQKYMK